MIRNLLVQVRKTLFDLITRDNKEKEPFINPFEVDLSLDEQNIKHTEPQKLSEVNEITLNIGKSKRKRPIEYNPNVCNKPTKKRKVITCERGMNTEYVRKLRNIRYYSLTEMKKKHKVMDYDKFTTTTTKEKPTDSFQCVINETIEIKGTTPINNNTNNTNNTVQVLNTPQKKDEINVNSNVINFTTSLKTYPLTENNSNINYIINSTNNNNNNIINDNNMTNYKHQHTPLPSPLPSLSPFPICSKENNNIFQIPSTFFPHTPNLKFSFGRK